MILGPEGLGHQNYLMLGIDQSLDVVALDDVVRGAHLYRFIVDHIALDFFAVAASLGFLLL